MKLVTRQATKTDRIHKNGKWGMVGFITHLSEEQLYAKGFTFILEVPKWIDVKSLPIADGRHL
jgi:hypothetical protein